MLSALEITLGLDDAVIKSASIDILSYIVEFSPSMVREYMMQQQHKTEEVRGTAKVFYVLFLIYENDIVIVICIIYFNFIYLFFGKIYYVWKKWC